MKLCRCKQDKAPLGLCNCVGTSQTRSPPGLCNCVEASQSRRVRKRRRERTMTYVTKECANSTKHDDAYTLLAIAKNAAGTMPAALLLFLITQEQRLRLQP